jgi:hypothetical protein
VGMQKDTIDLRIRGRALVLKRVRGPPIRGEALLSVLLSHRHPEAPC